MECGWVKLSDMAEVVNTRTVGQERVKGPEGGGHRAGPRLLGLAAAALNAQLLRKGTCVSSSETCQTRWASSALRRRE
ncbi:hypothetical protein GCM10017744_089730 [Streptomyces antimycoticus]|uniref:Uncharacterized protein n=1 Tax=Streptomyces antimycoticus TaxID=68175 RepID=A0A4D4JZZ2_9ACTN|nr:hypothetical protein SANT12839_001650 [Streptomyces antimycoticus]